MATNESEFKQEFKKDLGALYDGAHIWTSNDRVTSGLPDFFVLWAGIFVAIEAKFVNSLPKRKTSLVLSKHPVTPTQAGFLRKTNANGQYGIVLIGSPTAALVMREIKDNYTLEECLSAPRILKSGGQWQLKGFLDEFKK